MRKADMGVFVFIRIRSCDLEHANKNGKIRPQRDRGTPTFTHFQPQVESLPQQLRPDGSIPMLYCYSQREAPERDGARKHTSVTLCLTSTCL